MQRFARDRRMLRRFSFLIWRRSSCARARIDSGNGLRARCEHRHPSGLAFRRSISPDAAIKVWGSSKIIRLPSPRGIWSRSIDSAKVTRRVFVDPHSICEDGKRPGSINCERVDDKAVSVWRNRVLKQNAFCCFSDANLVRACVAAGTSE